MTSARQCKWSTHELGMYTEGNTTTTSSSADSTFFLFSTKFCRTTKRWVTPTTRPTGFKISPDRIRTQLPEGYVERHRAKRDWNVRNTNPDRISGENRAPSCTPIRVRALWSQIEDPVEISGNLQRCPETSTVRKSSTDPSARNLERRNLPSYLQPEDNRDFANKPRKIVTPADVQTENFFAASCSAD